MGKELALKKVASLSVGANMFCFFIFWFFLVNRCSVIFVLGV